MRCLEHRKVYRVIDANANRAKEGLRVCEDISRFFLGKKVLASGYKNIRHGLSAALAGLSVSGASLINARDIKHDVGKRSIESEFKRKDIQDIFYANSQRCKESLRVLEEFAKLIDLKSAQEFKNIRYRIYALESRALRQL